MADVKYNHYYTAMLAAGLTQYVLFYIQVNSGIVNELLVHKHITAMSLSTCLL